MNAIHPHHKIQPNLHPEIYGPSWDKSDRVLKPRSDLAAVVLRLLRCQPLYWNLCELWLGSTKGIKKKKNEKMYLLGQHAHLVLVLLVISELDLNLESSKLDGVLQPDRMRPFQNCLLCLFIQQVELDWIPDIINNNKFVIS